MLMRLFLIAIFSAALGAAAIVFEAASSTLQASNLVVSAGATASPVVRERVLGQAQATLRRSWARPLRWHAGATEAMSAAAYILGEAGDDDAFDESADWAERTVRLAPVQPLAWLRLADLAERGHGAEVCSATQCLERSFRTAPMLAPEAACARLQLAQRQGMLSADDPRIDAYLRSGVGRREAAECLSFLPAEDLFRVLMRSLQTR